MYVLQLPPIPTSQRVVKVWEVDVGSNLAYCKLVVSGGEVYYSVPGSSGSVRDGERQFYFSGKLELYAIPQEGRLPMVEGYVRLLRQRTSS